jgi:hypothetical protein
MAAVTAEQKSIKIRNEGKPIPIPVISGGTIYGGTLGIIEKTGYLDNLTSSNYHQARAVVYIADRTANTSGTPAATTSAGSISGSRYEASAVAGDKTVRECFIQGDILVPFTSITQSDLGKTVYAQNNFTLDEVTGTGIKVGMLVEVLSTSLGWVRLNTWGQKDGLVRVRLPFTANTTHAVGDTLPSWLNPTGETILVHYGLMDVGTKSTGAATVDIGVSTVSGSSDILFDGLDIGTAAGVFNSTVSGGSNGTGCVKLTSGQYITADTSADTTGLVASLILVYSIEE